MIRTSVQRARHSGDIDWVEKLADKLDLWSTLRSQDSPRSKKRPFSSPRPLFFADGLSEEA